MVFSEPSWRIVNYIWLVRIKEPPCRICEPGSEADPPVSSVPHCTGIALIDIIREVQTLGTLGSVQEPQFRVHLWCSHDSQIPGEK
jgi:hypothetical protein